MIPCYVSLPADLLDIDVQVKTFPTALGDFVFINATKQKATAVT
jgi:hypothetical protein